MKIYTLKFLFLIFVFFTSCRDDLTIRTRLNVWEATPYIPNALVEADYAQLDKKTACILRFRNDDIGYIYFNKADKWHALYESGILFTTNSHVGYRNVVANGLVRLGQEAPIMLCGSISIRWGPPTTIFFLSDDITHVALMEIERLPIIEPDFTNSLTWVSVKVPPL
jgi:hypothetical protein